MIADSENGTFGATSAAADQTLTISAALHHAIEHHKAGRLPEAERLYRAILQADPRQPDAHHNLGQLARQVGQPRAALPHLKAALEAKPEVAQYWLSLIAALIECNEVQAARSLLDQARSRGLSGAALEALDARLNAVAPALPQSSAPPAAEPNAPAVHAAKYSAMGAAHALLQPAIDMRECGDYAGAEAWLRAHLAQQPEDVAALALLAQVLLLRKDDAQAAQVLQRAAGIDAQHPAVLRNQARLKLKQNAAQEALVLAEAAYAGEPTLESRLLRAAVLAAVQRGDEAAREIDAILAAKPDYAEAWANRALIALRTQKFEEAIAAAERAVAIKPHLAQVWQLLASLRMQHRHDLAGAIAALQKSLSIEPDDVARLADLGEFLRRAKRLDEALQVLQRAVSLDANSYAAWVNYGTALQEAERLDEAKAAYEKALAINPRSAEVANNLGAMAKDREDWEEALRYFEQALAVKPDHAEILSNKAAALAALERFDEAIRAFAEAIRLKPKAAEYRLASALLLPSIMDSPAAIAQWRARYQEGIAALHGELDDIRDLSKVSPKFFYLAYHDADDRLIMESLCRLFRSKAPQLNYTAPHIAHWQMPQNRPIRIGFCSQFLCSHTIGKLYQGIIRGLDRQRFEVVLIYPPKAKRDAIRTALEQSADRVVALTGKLPQWQAQVAALEPDVFFYPDIGMSPATYFLAYARLAPVQVVSYGHPDTTGIDTLDYFLGGDPPLEATGAEAHYSERLIRCPRLPFCYQIFTVPKNIPSRAELGLPETGTLYGCPQSLFKLHPDFDAVLAEIAAGDPKGHIVLIDGQVKAWNDRLRQRWLKTSPILNERVRFVPRCSLDKFMALLAHFDVVLDPIHFGSGNTLYESMAYGKPIVTWPGRFARGRFVAAAYQQMGLTDVAPIAPSIETYAATALAFGRDAERRRAFTERALAVASRELYGDVQTVRLFETVVIAALQAAARGEKLPSGWRVPQEAASTGRTLGDAR